MPEEAAASPEGPPKGPRKGASEDTAPAAAAAAAAATAATAATAAAPQQQQQQQQQGKRGKVRFKKNSPNTFTFRLLHAPQHQLQMAGENGQQQPQQRMHLQRVVPPNARDKPQQPLPEFLQKQLDRQEAAEEEAASRLDGRSVSAKPKGQKTPDLTDDCYFPQDGYDYSQHLVSVGGGTFLPHQGNDVIVEEEKETVARMERDREGRQVLAALEACEDYEEIADDFIASAVTDSDGKLWVPNEKELLWGSRPPLLPPAISDRLFGERENGDNGDSAYEDEEELLDEYGDYTEEETDSQAGDARIPAVPRTADPDDTQAQRLEHLLEQYRDDQIGELEPEDAEESDSFSVYDECFDNFLKSQERQPAVESRRPGTSHSRRRDSYSSDSSISSSSSDGLKRETETFRLCEIDEDLRQKTLALAKMQEDEEHQASTVHAEPLLPARARPTWDGETIISARSGVSVQPRSIILGSSRASKFSLAPCLALGEGTGTRNGKGPRRAQLPPTLEDAETIEFPEVSTFRPRGETPEERKERKAKVKEAQRLMRANKKANKELLKEETKKAQAVQARVSAFDIRPGVRHFKL